MRSRRGRRQSLAPREVVLGLDPFERKISLFGAGIAFVLAIVTAVEWKRNLPTITKTNYTGKSCPSAFPTHFKTFCEHIVKTTSAQWEIKFIFVVVVAACILFFALRRKRAGVATFSVFLGLGLGLGSGLIFFFMGAWLIMRAYRLQKYGVATMIGSNRVAREMAQAKREGRAPEIEPFAGTTSTSSAAAPRSRSSTKTPAKPTGPEASKRYTPKKPAPKRR